MSAPGAGPGLPTGPGAGAGAVDHVGVLVPARDEEELLGRCLHGLAAAAEALRAERPGVRTRVVVVLDGCVDDSRGAVETAPWPSGLTRPEVLQTAAAGVGAARSVGAARLLGHVRAADGAPARSWLAGTDADSVVPASWLLAQVEAAEQGWDAWVGTVVLSARDRLASRWAEQQQHVEGHLHVHGANLGVRGSAYTAAGGYPPVLTGEDGSLVEALQATGARLLRTAGHPVVTSDRRSGRAPGGVAADLQALAALDGEPRAS